MLQKELAKCETELSRLIEQAQKAAEVPQAVEVCVPIGEPKMDMSVQALPVETSNENK